MVESILTPEVGADDHVAGGAHAIITLVEYGDPNHPVNLGADGRGSALSISQFPACPKHLHAAQVAEAAGAQRKFWLMHDRLFENQANLEDDDLIFYATKMGLDARKLAADLHSQRAAAKIQADFLGGVESGVNGTPSLFIGSVRFDGVRFDGDWRGDRLFEALQRELPTESG